LWIQPAGRSWFNWLGTKIPIEAKQADEYPDGLHDKGRKIKVGYERDDDQSCAHGIQQRVAKRVAADAIKLEQQIIDDDEHDPDVAEKVSEAVFHFLVAVAELQSLISIDAAIAQEGPVLARLVQLVQIAIHYQHFFLVSRRLRDDAAEWIRNERLAPEI
jgi:hypothetical protein